jgi:predicted ester cyclase
MEVTSNKNPIADYFETHDTKYIAEDAVFINMYSGEKTIGRQAIGEMLHYIYHIAFDAHADIINTIITKDKAVLEANFVGKHIGEFAGISATQKNVEVPLCVTYDLDNDLIKRARIYMSSTIMMQQLNA